MHDILYDIYNDSTLITHQLPYSITSSRIQSHKSFFKKNKLQPQLLLLSFLSEIPKPV